MTQTLDMTGATGLRVANVDALELRIANTTIWTAPVTSFTIWGATTPGNGGVWKSEGAGTIIVGNRFYTSESTGITVLGYRIWMPSGAVLTLDVTGTAYLDDWQSSAILASTTFAGPVRATAGKTSTHVAGWNTVMFPTPFHLNPISGAAGTLDLLTIAVQFSGTASNYAGDFGLGGANFDSVTNPGTKLAEASGFYQGIYNLNGGLNQGPNFYGIDLVFTVP